MDKFKEYINRVNDSIHIERALTTQSYKNKYLRENSKPLPRKTNFELATYGDAILKLILCEIYFDKIDKLTEYIKKYLTDKVLVEVIAKHYSILEYLFLDDQDINIKKDYVWDEKNNHKYIADAIEAMIAAIYLESKDYNIIKIIIKIWIELIDNTTNNTLEI